jgi:hypothetical protein
LLAVRVNLEKLAPKGLKANKVYLAQLVKLARQVHQDQPELMA